jgi:hypothetical protein
LQGNGVSLNLLCHLHSRSIVQIQN